MRLNIKESGRRLARYLRDTRLELKKIIWPGRKETIVFTTVVVVTVVLVSGVMWLMDMVFSSVVGTIIR
ncbi:MAG: preprotein translocase subunit SecE [Firmicutes bacterium]|jgi:preprotein translocase subunit SecE|nr:preprotein translocase subunit SecE [Bacillota bacterium]